MEYTKIKVASKDDPKRFYRIIAVANDPDLYQLGVIIGKSIRCWFEHMFFFRDGINTYCPDKYCEQDFDEPLSYYYLSDMEDKFVYEYDAGESYEFNITVMKRKYYDDEDDDSGIMAKVIEGAGQGIFENDHSTLWRILAGVADLESPLDKNDYDGPMNMEEFEKLGDFFKPLNLDEMVYMEEDINNKVFSIYGFNEEDLPFYDEDDEEYDEYDDIDPEEIRDTVYHMMECQIAYDIFYDDELNDVYTNLLQSHNMQEAFEMISETYINSMYEGNSEGIKDSEELHNFCLKKIKSLMIRH
ncbi:MAG: hypothetical protein ACI4WM_01655 [Erysipelotrichaceae bacterium]